jgi:flavin reductase (DIM6/NTAB) family NADH-FMN oxidoreductase RutF
MINIEALFKVSYGLYIVCSGDKNRGNGFISNSVFQVTAEPPKFAVCCNKENFTAEFIQRYNAFSVSVLDQNVSSEIIRSFGYRSGKDFDKMAGNIIRYGDTGVPVILNESIAFFEIKLLQTVDAGTHLIFIGELINAEILYKSKNDLKSRRYKCPACGYVYDDSSEKVKFEDLPENWVCPTCGTEKSEFFEI